MIILAIETSCDDTGIAIIKASGKKRPRFEILSNVVSSQVEVHRKWGGVYPTLAKREHQKNLVPVLKKALKKARMLKTQKVPIKSRKLEKILEREKELYKKLKQFLQTHQKPSVDAIAVTMGPGLEPCLWVGVNFAKALSYFWDVPIIPTNHIEAHIVASFIGKERPRFPAICLVASGGHTQLILMKDFGKYKILGETRDDAAGECFDKAAKILGLPYPGGPAIAAYATNCKSRVSVDLPRPMIHTKDYDFSFSGLKTAVLYHHQKQSKKTQRSQAYRKAMACEIQQAILDVLIAKTIRAAREYRARTIILGGGVAANSELRKQLKKSARQRMANIEVLMPPKNLCTDNAAMIGAAAYFGKKKRPEDIAAKANLRLL